LFFEDIIVGADTLNAGVGIDPLVAVVDTAGNIIDLKDIHGDGYYDEAFAIASDTTGNLYVGGQVSDSIAEGSAVYVSNGGNTDFFVIKYGYDCDCVMPVAGFTAASAGELTLNFSYNGTTTGLDSVTWNFGDGTTGTGSTVTHTYPALGYYYPCATAYTACGSDTYCDSVLFAESVPGINNADVAVYPNPVTTQLIIDNATAGSSIRLYDLLGQMIYSGTVLNGEQVINTRRLVPGTYILQITDGQGNRLNRTIVKE
jgi:PKD repeat protein